MYRIKGFFRKIPIVPYMGTFSEKRLIQQDRRQITVSYHGHQLYFFNNNDQLLSKIIWK